jgi:hypothetical protein
MEMKINMSHLNLSFFDPAGTGNYDPHSKTGEGDPAFQV